MSKYCLLVWHEKKVGSVVYDHGSPFIGSKCSVKEYKTAMKNLHPSAEYRLVKIDNIKEIAGAIK